MLSIMDSIWMTLLLQLDCKKESTDTKSKRVSRVCAIKKEPSSETEHSTKRVTRRSLGQSKSSGDNKILEISEHSKAVLKKNSRSSKGANCRLRKGTDNASAKEIPQASSSDGVRKDAPSTSKSKEVAGKKSNSLPECKRRKVYSLRQSSQVSNRRADSLVDDSGKKCLQYFPIYLLAV